MDKVEEIAERATQNVRTQFNLSIPHAATDIYTVFKSEVVAAIHEALAPYDFAPWKPPFKYDDMGTMVVDSESRMIVDVRGWGFLTGRGGGLGLNDDEAAKIQDRLGEHVAKLLNVSAALALSGADKQADLGEHGGV